MENKEKDWWPASTHEVQGGFYVVAIPKAHDQTGWIVDVLWVGGVAPGVLGFSRVRPDGRPEQRAERVDYYASLGCVWNGPHASVAVAREVMSKLPPPRP